MQIDDFQRMINRGVQFAVNPERFRQMRSLHHRRNAALPGNVGADDIHNAARNTFRGRIVRARENFRSANRNVELVGKFAESGEVNVEKRLLEPVVIQFFEFAPHAQSFLV